MEQLNLGEYLIKLILEILEVELYFFRESLFHTDLYHLQYTDLRLHHVLECDDISLSRHDRLDEIWTTCREEFSLEELEIFPESFEHLHRLIEIVFDDIIEEKCRSHFLSLTQGSFIFVIDTFHRL